MADDAGEFLRRWFQLAWVEGKTEYIETMAAPDVRIRGLDNSKKSTIGQSGFREFYDQMHASFSDFAFTLHDLIGADPAAARWTVWLRNTGDWRGVALACVAPPCNLLGGELLDKIPLAKPGARRVIWCMRVFPICATCCVRSDFSNRSARPGLSRPLRERWRDRTAGRAGTTITHA